MKLWSHTQRYTLKIARDTQCAWSENHILKARRELHGRCKWNKIKKDKVRSIIISEREKDKRRQWVGKSERGREIRKEYWKWIGNGQILDIILGNEDVIPAPLLLSFSSETLSIFLLSIIVIVILVCKFFLQKSKLYGIVWACLEFPL